MGSVLYLVQLLLSTIILYSHEIIADEDDNDEEDEVTSPVDVVEGEIGQLNIVGVAENNTTPFVDRSAEAWVRDAVLDVAYYLRSHKFNDFDRRYYKESIGEYSAQYKRFPSPPLRYLHWEVYKNCDLGFYDCLAYLQDTALKADLVRSLDTNFIANQRHWEWPRNLESILQVDKECRRLKQKDWTNADPFKGPLERFQWRVSASYYMCHFTLLEYSPLVMFGERCDNFASCLESKRSSNGDPRADDSKPFQCAMYSFCPDVCCPAKEITKKDECLDNRENPCSWQAVREKRECTFIRELNQDMSAIALNEWNVTCECETGFVWDSMFGMCVDVDECSTGRHSCSGNQTCVNLKGHYGCVCAWGYINNTGNCEPNTVLTDNLAKLYNVYHAPPTAPPRPFSILEYLFDLVRSPFSKTENTAFPPSKTGSTDLPSSKTETTDLPLVRNINESLVTLPVNE